MIYGVLGNTVEPEHGEEVLLMVGDMTNPWKRAKYDTLSRRFTVLETGKSYHLADALWQEV